MQTQSSYEALRAIAAVARENEAGDRAMQWAPTGVYLEGQPGLMARFLATDGTVRGYAGHGDVLEFGTPSVPLRLRTSQWAVIHTDGRITAEDVFEGAVTPFPDGPECRHHFMPGGLDHHHDCTCSGRSAEAQAPTYDDEPV